MGGTSHFPEAPDAVHATVHRRGDDPEHQYRERETVHVREEEQDQNRNEHGLKLHARPIDDAKGKTQRHREEAERCEKSDESPVRRNTPDGDEPPETEKR